MYSRKKNFLSKIHLDWPLFFGILAISLLGILILYSAKPGAEVIQKQILRFVLACAIMIAIAQIPIRVLKKATPWLYCSGLLLLMVVLGVGHVSKGAQRWLDLWFFRFQPAELMKISVPMMVAYYLDQRVLPPRPATLLLPLVLILIPSALIAKQPDLGTALLILSSGLLVIFFSGIHWRFIATLGGILLSCCPILWYGMRDYQKQRILVLLDPERDPLGTGYHIIQSKIAIGSGGVYGKGWLKGSQAHLEFLPEGSTDFIFAVFGEEFGFVGCLILLALYLCIIMRGLYISVQAQDTYSRLLSGSLIMTLFVYVFVNMSMVTGILPVVGIPLPLMSYGGTSLVTLMASFGILMTIHTHRKLLPS